VTYVRSCEKLPPCLIKPVTTDSKTDPPLPKAKPISDSDTYFYITYLKKGRKKTSVVKQHLERGVRRSERNNSANTTVSEEGGEGGGAQNVGAESLPLLLVMKAMVKQAVPLQSMKVHGGADIHL